MFATGFRVDPEREVRGPRKCLWIGRGLYREASLKEDISASFHNEGGSVSFGPAMT